MLFSHKLFEWFLATSVFSSRVMKKYVKVIPHLHTTSIKKKVSRLEWCLSLEITNRNKIEFLDTFFLEYDIFSHNEFWIYSIAILWIIYHSCVSVIAASCCSCWTNSNIVILISVNCFNYPMYHLTHISHLYKWRSSTNFRETCVARKGSNQLINFPFQCFWRTHNDNNSEERW